MTVIDAIRRAEAELWRSVGLQPDESFLELHRTGLRVRVLAHGVGSAVILLHGMSLTSAAWTPLLGSMPGYRLHAVELPGHGLSDPITYHRLEVRQHAHDLLDDIFDALGVEHPALVGHSLGGMFALWYAALDTERIASLALIGDPAVALPGVTVRMPLSLMTVPGASIMLRSPTPRAVYRRMLAHALGGHDAAAAPTPMVEALRLAGRRVSNARTVASLMHSINGFRRPRPESVLTPDELGRITVPTLCLWGTDDPYLSPEQARPSVRLMPAATLVEVPGDHAPWLAEPRHTAELLHQHLTNTGFPATGRPTPHPGGRPGTTPPIRRRQDRSLRPNPPFNL